jgi:putative peptidoglycan lipid II flippase
MSSRLARSAGLISIATLASRLLGLARDTVLASIFGASAGPQMDAYNVAFRIPNLLRDLFAEGAMTAAFVPTFTRTLTSQGREAAWRLGNLVINALLLVTGVLVVLGMVFAREITAAIADAEEFAGVPGKLELTVQLTRIMLPFLATIAVAVAMMGMLNSLRRFFIPALAPAMFNVATIACALFLVPFMPQLGLAPIVAIAIGTLLGGLGQMALQWPLLRAEGFRYRPVFDFRNPALREILRLMGPGTLGLAAVQINVLVNTFLATTQEQGAVSWLGYAFRLMYLPIGLFGVSIAMAALPDVSRQVHAGEMDKVRRTVSSALRMMLMLNVPATIGLVLLAVPIVQMLLERRAFTPYDTWATSIALMCYAPGLLGYSAVKIASPTFYSMGDSRTPVVVSVVSVLVNLGLNLVLVRVLGYEGLALGTAVAALLNAIVLLWMLRRRLNGLDGRELERAFTKIVIASLAMGAVAVLVAEWTVIRDIPAWMRAVFGEFWAREIAKALRVALSIGAGLVTLVAVARVLRITEFDEAMRRVLRRLAPAHQGRTTS